MSKLMTRHFRLALCAMLFALCLPAWAQQPKKVPRIGYLSSLSHSSDPRAEPLQRALHELGYIEGQNLVTEYRYAEAKFDRIRELTADLVRLKVDIIVVAGGDPPILAAKNASKTIPIVMIGIGSDPVEAGHIESLSRPGGNITGVTNLGRELSGKRLDLLKEAVPKLAHVGVLYEPAAAPASVIEVKEVLLISARALGLAIQPWELRAADDFDKVFAALGKQRPEDSTCRRTR